MDILSSKIINIEGRLYINYFEEETFDDHDCVGEAFSEPANAPTRMEAADSQAEVQRKFKHFIQCPSALFKYVIGYKGQTIKKLQEETGAKIEIPRGNVKSNGGITVTAKSSGNLEAAVTRIELLLSEKRWKQPFGHLVTIKLTGQDIINGFQAFRTEVLEKCRGDRGVTERLFQDEGKIHLTITTLTLLDDSECKKAIEVMNKILTSRLLTDAKGMTVSVRGIEYMNDDPQMVDVLYAKVSCPKNPDILQRLADYISQEFQEAGLAKKEYHHVKLHATVMNTIRTMEKAQHPQKGHRAPQNRETFNASNILTMFKEHLFGEFPLTEIHISKRYTADRDGYYDSLYVAKI